MLLVAGLRKSFTFCEFTMPPEKGRGFVGCIVPKVPVAKRGLGNCFSGFRMHF